MGATLWWDGLQLHPAPRFVLGGFLLYRIDGFVALQLAAQARNLGLHGTLHVAAHAMTTLIAVGMIWLGMLYPHRPRLRGWALKARQGFLHAGLILLAALRMFGTILWAGAEGIPCPGCVAGGGPMVWGRQAAAWGALRACLGPICGQSPSAAPARDRCLSPSPSGGAFPSFQQRPA
ncbi:MAG: hypothetical protein J7452_01285 [Thermoflexus sp.]|nr:hypothetical protein [Thermoflexus sp.]